MFPRNQTRTPQEQRTSTRLMMLGARALQITVYGNVSIFSNSRRVASQRKHPRACGIPRISTYSLELIVATKLRRVRYLAQNDFW